MGVKCLGIDKVRVRQKILLSDAIRICAKQSLYMLFVVFTGESIFAKTVCITTRQKLTGQEKGYCVGTV